jgi:hypothetical protein
MCQGATGSASVFLCDKPCSLRFFQSSDRKGKYKLALTVVAGQPFPCSRFALA